MNYIIGLGNPDEQYTGTRHNVGRDMVLAFVHKHKMGDPKYDKKSDALIVEGKFLKDNVTLIAPNTYMNKSGVSLSKVKKPTKKPFLNICVVHDDLDLPLGTFKLSVGKSSGGHRGVESVIKALGTNEFVRLRVGISPKDAKGRAKKPVGEEKVVAFVLGKPKGEAETQMKKVMKIGVEFIESVLSAGPYRAMNDINSAH